MEKTKLSDVSPKVIAYSLIQDHSFGAGFRDESEFETTRAHASKTFHFALELLKDVEGTVEEKIQHLENTIEELKKFTVKK